MCIYNEQAYKNCVSTNFKLLFSIHSQACTYDTNICHSNKYESEESFCVHVHCQT